MCGIAGFAGSGSREVAAAVERMLAAMARRGPDDEGLESFPTAVLGHRRLSIFDPSPAGHQPMTAPDGGVSIVFNGAIYNFLELRAELERAGCAFRSRTDTEVLLHGYRRWGAEELVRRLRGMFAIGLWDDRRRSLYLIRDRLGVKPLYYVERDGAVAFASTAAALQAASLAGPLDPLGVAEFLEFGYVTDDRSIYAGVKKVPAGTLLEWNAGVWRSQVYWRVPDIQAGGSAPFQEIVERAEALLLEAVRLRLHADVPVGALLSGGVDSSLVCWAIAQQGSNITAFTVGTPEDPEHDESAEAAATAARLGIPHEIIQVTAAGEPTFDDLAGAYGEPFACASALGMLRVSKAVRRAATVLLTGDGGDDVFLGYPEHRTLWMAQRLARRIPGFAARGFQHWRRILPERGAWNRARNFLGYATGGLRAVIEAHPGLEAGRAAGFLGPRLRQARVPAHDVAWSPASARRVLEEFLDYEHRTRFTGEYMTKVDGAAMYYALEARSPFLDQEIWNFAARLPLEQRLRGNALKAIPREIARRRLGERVSRARKRGFAIPVGRWLAGRWKPHAEDLLAGSVLEREGWISAPAVLQAFRRSAAAGEVPLHIWYVLVLEAWLRRRCVSLS
jgi:asparagine synthase (glutamine-hydrolysing)